MGFTPVREMLGSISTALARREIAEHGCVCVQQSPFYYRTFHQVAKMSMGSDHTTYYACSDAFVIVSHVASSSSLLLNQ